MLGGISLWYVIPAIMGSLVGVAGLVSAYLTSRRTTSGNIGTSNASEIWRENQLLRDFLKNQVSELTAKVMELQRKEEECEIRNGQLQLKVDTLEFEVRTLKAKLGEAAGA